MKKSRRCIHKNPHHQLRTAIKENYKQRLQAFRPIIPSRRFCFKLTKLPAISQATLETTDDRNAKIYPAISMEKTAVVGNL